MKTGSATLRQDALRLALPAVGEQVVLPGGGLVRVALAGRPGAAFLAALGLANQIIVLSLVLLMTLTVGGGVLVAQATGATPRELLRVGSPAGGEQLSLRLGQVVNARIVAELGTTRCLAGDRC